MRRHQPTEKNRTDVSSLKSFGHTEEDIAAYIGITVETLQKYYGEELRVAEVSANFKIAGKLFKKAYIDEDLTAIIFWLKTRARWRTEDHKQFQENNAEALREMRETRAKLDAQYRKEY